MRDSVAFVNMIVDAKHQFKQYPIILLSRLFNSDESEREVATVEQVGEAVSRSDSKQPAPSVYCRERGRRYRNVQNLEGQLLRFEFCYFDPCASVKSFCSSGYSTFVGSSRIPVGKISPVTHLNILFF